MIQHNQEDECELIRVFSKAEECRSHASGELRMLYEADSVHVSSAAVPDSAELQKRLQEHLLLRLEIVAREYMPSRDGAFVNHVRRAWNQIVIPKFLQDLGGISERPEPKDVDVDAATDHEKGLEAGLVQALTKALADRDQALEKLVGLYERDAAYIAVWWARKNLYEFGEEVIEGLKRYFLSRLHLQVKKYDSGKGASVRTFLINGWKQYYAGEYLKSCCPERDGRRRSLDGAWNEDDALSPADKIEDPRSDPHRSGEYRDLFLDLHDAFGLEIPELLAAVRDTIVGIAGPLQRRLALSVLARDIKCRRPNSRFWASRFWADVSTRRRMLRELSQASAGGD